MTKNLSSFPTVNKLIVWSSSDGDRCNDGGGDGGAYKHYLRYDWLLMESYLEKVYLRYGKTRLRFAPCTILYRQAPLLVTAAMLRVILVCPSTTMNTMLINAKLPMFMIDVKTYVHKPYKYLSCYIKGTFCLFVHELLQFSRWKAYTWHAY